MPGQLPFPVLYTLTDDNTLKVQFFATTDQPTPINLSQHSYFNLSCDGKGEVLPYVVKAYASHYLPVDAGLVPTGKIESVTGTPFDFTKPKTIGQDLKPLPGTPPGYNHTLVLDNKDATLAKAVEVYDPATGRGVECWTTEPAVHFSCARNLSNLPGKNGADLSALPGLRAGDAAFFQFAQRAGISQHDSAARGDVSSIDDLQIHQSGQGQRVTNSHCPIPISQFPITGVFAEMCPSAWVPS